MGRQAGSDRANELAAKLERASSSLIAVVAEIEPECWRHIPGPRIWAVGKDAEHVIEAAGYHEWIVRRTVGHKVPARPPILERRQLTTVLSRQAAVEQLRSRSADGAALIRGLTDEHLELPTRPPRARAEVLARTIERVMIGHYEAHRADIGAKSRALGDGTGT